MADLTDWSASATEAIQIRLKRHPSAAKAKDLLFQPAFTYAIFGEEEQIFGYQGLKIKIDFTADTFKPSLRVTWQQKYDTVGETKAADVEELLSPLLPGLEAGDTSNPPADRPTWEPPGELLHQYVVNGRTFGIWSTALTDPAAKELLRNMQILVLFFIDGGSTITLDDPEWTLERWKVFFIYAVDTPPNDHNTSIYSLVGYSTAYRLWYLDTSQGSDFSYPIVSATSPLLASDPTLQSRLPCRERISQFLILPPYHHQGHGSHLYTAMIHQFLSTTPIKEITVEDPNEQFDDLRDVNDILRLRRTNPSFTSLTLDTAVRLGGRDDPIPSSALLSPTTLTTILQASKLAPRQFARIVEMQLLSRIPLRNRQTARLTRKDKASDEQDRAYYFWRLLVKQRLYKHNLDSLVQLDIEERIDKLEETLNVVEKDYLRILEAVNKRAKLEDEAGVDVVATGPGAVEVNGKAASRSKRRRVLDDEDDEDEGEDESSDETRVPKHNGGSKKRKDVGLEKADKGKKRTKVDVLDFASSEL